MYQEDHKKDEAIREKQLDEQLAEREKLFGRVEELARGIETLQTEGWELESGNRRKTLPANRGGGRLQQPRYGRLDFPVYDGKNDPLVWLSRCEHYFRHQHMPESEKVEIACYHLDEDAQVWFLKLDIDRPGILWEEFKRECHRRFGPIVQGNKLRELCKLRQTGTVEEYQRKFEQLVTRASILTAEQEVEIFVSGLQEDIGLERWRSAVLRGFASIVTRFFHGDMNVNVSSGLMGWRRMIVRRIPGQASRKSCSLVLEDKRFLNRGTNVMTRIQIQKIVMKLQQSS
ncbi:retrotransposon gag protein, partial [Tanacetum coccineum]